MFKAPALALASLVVFASPAMAQRAAPITQGATSLDLADQVAQARQQSARLKVDVNALTGDLTNLTGRVETLEFQLQMAREENQNLTRDNEALADEIGELQNRLDAQSRTLQAMQGMLVSAGLMPEPEEAPTPEPSAYPGAAGAGLETSATGGQVAASGEGPRRLMSFEEYEAQVEAARVRAQGEAPATAEVRSQTVSAASAGAIESPAPEPEESLPLEAGPLFAAAKTKLINFDYAGAEQAFRTFIDNFGSDPQAGEAHYWLGESLYQQKAYAESGAAYTTMIRSYPDDPRAPDALVKLARAMRLVGDKDKACLALNTLPKRYPNASGVTQDLAAVERTKSGCD